MQVRLAELSDIPELVQSAQDVIEELPTYRSIPVAIPSIESFLETLVLNPTKFTVLVAEDQGSIRGFMLGCVIPHWFSTKITHAADLLLYVHPDFRNGAYAVRLIREFEKWAVHVGCTRLRLSTSTGFQEDRTKALYTRLGYIQIGSIHEKEMPCVQVER